MRRLLLLPVISLSLSASVISDTNFIEKVFQDVLNRPANPGEVSTYLTYLGTPGDTRQGMALQILTTTEYRTDLVASYYQAYLHRPTDSGAAILVTALGGGATDEQVQSMIVGSPEYFGDHGSDNTQFIDGVYLDLLNRPASPGDVSLGMIFLGGNTRGQFAGFLLSTTEYDNLLVNTYFAAYLNRPPDSTEHSFYVPELQSSISNEVVQSQIIGTSEFYNAAQSVPEPASSFQLGIGTVLMWLGIRRRLLRRA